MKTSLSRRTTLAGLAILPATAMPMLHAHATSVPAGQPDPVITLLEDYHRGMAAFEAIPESTWGALGGHDAVYAQTWKPPFEAITDFGGAATSKAGAIAALKFVLRDTDENFSSPIVAPLVAAALGYLEKQEA